MSEQYGGPVTLSVFLKGGSPRLLLKRFEWVWVSTTKQHRVRVSDSEPYGALGTIVTGDFDFDGAEDFAVQTGHDGPYGGPTFSVYLYSPTQRKFHFSESFSRLTRETLGFFVVDRKAKRIITFAKSGCCYHETVEHIVVNHSPVAVLRVIEDAMDGGDAKVSYDRRVNGVWRRDTARNRTVPAR